MHSDLALFRLATAKAEYAAQRQSITAQNMAHADTPGYKARDLPAFGEVYQGSAGPSGMRATRAAHFTEGLSPILKDSRPVLVPGNESPNGNTVSIETEMIRATEVKRDHDLALTVYGSGMKLLRAALGN